MKENSYLLLHFFHKIINHSRPQKLHIELNDIYHNIIMHKLDSLFDKALEASRINKSEPTEYNSGIIWMFWWQGTKGMPLIVKCCVRSIMAHSNGHKVILISKYNIRKYTNLPNYIYNKVASGNISLTHLSDILRFNLLVNYGGLWVDSTVYCTSDLKNDYFDSFYTSRSLDKSLNKNHDFISTKWTGFLIGGYKDKRIFRFMNNFFKLYWKHNTQLIDYFLIDYALNYVYLHNISNFKYYTNKIAYKNNPNLYELVKNLNKPFNKNQYKNMISNTNLFKLTYKMKFNTQNNTFYDYITKNN